MAAQTVLIKKYENRRLYDTANSRYVNLDDIAQMVRDGVDVRVVDAATGEDLTRLVLTQIIVEKAKVPGSAFPLEMLRQMIMATGRLSQEGLRAYMKATLDFYQNTYGAFMPPFAPFASATGRSSESQSAADETPAPEERQEGSGNVDELRRRIEELERLVAKGQVHTNSATKRKPRSSK